MRIKAILVLFILIMALMVTVPATAQDNTAIVYVDVPNATVRTLPHIPFGDEPNNTMGTLPKGTELVVNAAFHDTYGVTGTVTCQVCKPATTNYEYDGGYWLHFETWHDDDYVEGWIYSGVTTAREDGARDLELPELSREVLEIMSGAARGYSANMDVSFEFNPDGWMITIPAGVNLRWIPEVHPDTKAYETEMTSTYESYMRVTLVDTDQVWYVITDTEYNTPAFVASWVNGLQVDG